MRFRVQGESGKLPAAVATPLAVVLTELLQNAVSHAFPGASSGEGNVDRSVVVELEVHDEHLTLRVVDNGVGLPADFDLEQPASLGLSIVRTLVTTELAGTITMQSPPEGGTAVELVVPVHPHR